MNRLIYLIIFTLNCCLLFSITNDRKIISFKRQINLDTSIYISKPQIKQVKDSLFVLQVESYQIDDEFPNYYYVILENISTNIKYRLIITEDLKEEEIIDITLNDSLVYVLYSKKVIIFKKMLTSKKDNYVNAFILNKKNLEFSFRHIEMVLNKVLLYKDTYSNFKENKEKQTYFYFCIIDFDKSKIEKNIMPINKGYVFANLKPKKIFFIKDSNIIWSDYLQYNLFKTNVFTNITTLISQRNNIDGLIDAIQLNQLDFIMSQKESYNGIYELQFKYSGYFRVNFINRLNDSVFAVIYSAEKDPKNPTQTTLLKPKLYLDVWKYDKYKAELILKDFNITKEKKESQFSEHTLLESTDFYFSNNKLYLLSDKYPFEVIKYLNKSTLKQIDSVRNDFATENSNIIYSLFEFDINY